MVSPRLNHVHQLARIQRLYKTQIAVDRTVKDDIGNKWVLRPLVDSGLLDDVVSVKNLDVGDRAIVRECPGTLWRSKRAIVRECVQGHSGDPKKVIAFELGVQKKVDMDEWMYELEQPSSLSLWDSNTGGITELVEHGRIEKSHEVLSVYLCENPKDHVAQYTADIVGIALQQVSEQTAVRCSLVTPQRKASIIYIFVVNKLKSLVRLPTISPGRGSRNTPTERMRYDVQ